jgi:predicted ribosomally synthesized peptide with SipW-like signal peptide
MKKILGLTIVFMLLIGMTGIGTWAYFSDIETSQSNTFAAGTLDLKTGDSDGVSQTLLATNMAPGDTVGSETIILRNNGTVAGSTLDLSFSYTESDGSANPTDMTEHQTAAMIEVTKLNYGTDNLLLIGISDYQLNGYTDIEDLMNADADLSGQSGIADLGSKVFEIEVKLRDDTDNAFQSDGITIIMTFTLNQ